MALRLFEDAYLAAARNSAPHVPLCRNVDLRYSGEYVRAEITFVAREPLAPASARYDEQSDMAVVMPTVHRHSATIHFLARDFIDQMGARTESRRDLGSIIQGLFSDMAEDCAMQFEVARRIRDRQGADGYHRAVASELHMLEHHARWDFTYSFSRDTTALRDRRRALLGGAEQNLGIAGAVARIVGSFNEALTRTILSGNPDADVAAYDGDWLGIGAAMEGALGGLDPNAEARGIDLLMEHLTPAQRADYEKAQSFTVVGSRTGKTYRIKHGRQQNVFELDKRGKTVRGICFLPSGNLCAGDCMTAQKIALETDEDSALRVAIEFRTGGLLGGFMGMEVVIDETMRLDEARIELRTARYGSGLRRSGIVRLTDVS